MIETKEANQKIKELKKISKVGQEKIRNSYYPLELDKAMIYKKKKYDSGKRNWK